MGQARCLDISVGYRKRVREKAPMASFVHCNAHCLDLVLQEAGKSVPFVREALSVVHDIATFLNGSALRRASFSEVQRKLIEDKRIAEEESVDVDIFREIEETDSDVSETTVLKNESVLERAPTGVRKLCVTRWLARTPACFAGCITGI